MEDAPWSLGFPNLQNKAALSLLSTPYVVACDFQRNLERPNTPNSCVS